MQSGQNVLNIDGTKVLKTDLSWDMYGDQQMVQQIIKPITYTDLLSWETLRFPKDEFKILRQLCHSNQHNEALTSYDPVAFKMNRYTDIIPCKLFILHNFL